MHAPRSRTQHLLRRLAVAAGLIAAASMAACLEDLPDPSLVDKARVLAVRASPPEIAPGDSTTLDALVVDPEGRAVSFQWVACLVPERGRGFFSGSGQTSSSGGQGVGLDDPGSCVEALARGDAYASDLGTGTTATFEAPADIFDTQAALQRYYELPEDLEIPSPIDTFFESIGGVNFAVTLIVDVDGGPTLEAFKRVNVASPSATVDAPPNRNPEDVRLHAATRDADAEPPETGTPPPDGRCFLGEDGETPVSFRAGETYTLSVVNVPDPQPEYQVILAGTTSPDQPFELTGTEENTFLALFSTAGGLGRRDIQTSREDRVTWQIPDDAGDRADFWTVIRDGRGGTDWCHSPVDITR